MNTATKRLVIGGAVAGGSMLLAAGLVIGAGIAKADTNLPTYGTQGDQNPYLLVAELRAVGWDTATPAGVESEAWHVCALRASGTSRRALIDLYETKYSSSVSIQMEMGAEWHFCPAYDSVQTPVPTGPDTTVGYVHTAGHGGGRK